MIVGIFVSGKVKRGKGVTVRDRLSKQTVVGETEDFVRSGVKEGYDNHKIENLFM